MVLSNVLVILLAQIFIAIYYKNHLEILFLGEVGRQLLDVGHGHVTVLHLKILVFISADNPTAAIVYK